MRPLTSNAAPERVFFASKGSPAAIPIFQGASEALRTRRNLRPSEMAQSSARQQRRKGE
ncbi:hypothetical protein AKJ09_07264 [Labilithrix luteola]|uniref:Uncharacterized protein n=1 Tax=Labilithrix luteola TaxID=1391654 RepID=A0A0K1Q443_9BACT|nr:hypothetical protein AKJ09_07264 [Labilithrix luteola]